LPVETAVGPLRRHSERRKYTEKADSWFGVCLGSRDARMRFGVTLDYPWKQDAGLDEAAKKLPRPAPNIEAALRQTATKQKVGRNDPCPCGSGLKYKKCCLA
jgi:preprotein translocase subunit SecA